MNNRKSMMKQTVSRWINGPTIPSRNNLGRLARVLGVGLDGLMNGIDQEGDTNSRWWLYRILTTQWM